MLLLKKITLLPKVTNLLPILQIAIIKFHGKISNHHKPSNFRFINFNIDPIKHPHASLVRKSNSPPLEQQIESEENVSKNRR
jgi:hypothetical protein